MVSDHPLASRSEECKGCGPLSEKGGDGRSAKSHPGDTHQVKVSKHVDDGRIQNSNQRCDRVFCAQESRLDNSEQQRGRHGKGSDFHIIHRRVDQRWIRSVANVERQQGSSKSEQKEHDADAASHRHSTGRTDDRLGLVGLLSLLRYGRRVEVGRRHVQKGKEVGSAVKKGRGRPETRQLGRGFRGDLGGQPDKGGVDQRQERLRDPQSQTGNGKVSKIRQRWKCGWLVVDHIRAPASWDVFGPGCAGWVFGLVAVVGILDRLERGRARGRARSRARSRSRARARNRSVVVAWGGG
mmetsp:Transcript_29158/g.78899  ORF Transcript_29158/g.78899 Transcript_29158/m.78899 type:complete len:296 (-) Transcript_29158:274-1161(-)